MKGAGIPEENPGQLEDRLIRVDLSRETCPDSLLLQLNLDWYCKWQLRLLGEGARMKIVGTTGEAWQDLVEAGCAPEFPDGCLTHLSGARRQFSRREIAAAFEAFEGLGVCQYSPITWAAGLVGANGSQIEPLSWVAIPFDGWKVAYLLDPVSKSIQPILPDVLRVARFDDLFSHPRCALHEKFCIALGLHAIPVGLS